MDLAERIFQDLRNYLIQPEVINHTLDTRWIFELLRSESQKIPFIEIKEEHVSFDSIKLWRSLKKKVPKATDKKHLDKLIELWAKKIFARVQRDVEEANQRSVQLRNLSATLTGSVEETFTEGTPPDHIRLFEYIHTDLKQFLEQDSTVQSRSLSSSPGCSFCGKILSS